MTYSSNQPLKPVSTKKVIFILISDIEMLLNLENFSEDQIGKDVGLQLEMEKARVLQR